jgi:Fe-S oxidoreductase
MNRLCCGRPLYDYGFLDMAKGYLQNLLAVLKPQIETGTPVVVLEPSCLAVFRDELKDLLPHHHDAQRLSKQSFTLAEFLEKMAPHYSPPQLQGKLVVHGHCHQKALIGLEHESNLLKKMGADVSVLDTGCCGMAGSFGFEEHKFEISSKVFAHELRLRWKMRLRTAS